MNTACYLCEMGTLIHNHPAEATWRVPSRTQAGRLYVVTLFSLREYACNCRWGRSPRTSGKCYHVRAALSQLPMTRRQYPALAVEVQALARLIQQALREREAFPFLDYPDEHAALDALVTRSKVRLDELLKSPRTAPASPALAVVAA